MSNPVSSLSESTNASPRPEADEPAAGSETPLAEVTADAEPDAEPDADESLDAEEEEERSSGFLGVVVILLGLALIVSVAVNLKLSRDVATISAQSQELERALGSAVERIDVEAARAASAEAALDRVDSAVDVVNERVLGLQEALDQLREATVR